jgi:hypothetical protein
MPASESYLMLTSVLSHHPWMMTPDSVTFRNIYEKFDLKLTASVV